MGIENILAFFCKITSSTVLILWNKKVWEIKKNGIAFSLTNFGGKNVIARTRAPPDGQVDLDPLGTDGVVHDAHVHAGIVDLEKRKRKTD